MQEYTDAKMNLFAHQTDTDFAVLGQDIAHLANEYGFKAKTIVFDADKKNFPKTKLLGQHNQSNAEAAWQACQLFGVSFENARKAMEKISPMENRLEFVRELDGITYINDSKCTTVTALAVAIKAVSEAEHPIILLAGGKFKGGDLAALLPLMRGKVKHVALYGGSREYFENAWKNHLSPFLMMKNSAKPWNVRNKRLIKATRFCSRLQPQVLTNMQAISQEAAILKILCEISNEIKELFRNLL